MIHLAQQKVFLPQQFVLLAFQSTTLGDIFDRHQQACAIVALIENFSGIQEHRASTNRRKSCSTSNPSIVACSGMILPRRSRNEAIFHWPLPNSKRARPSVSCLVTWKAR